MDLAERDQSFVDLDPVLLGQDRGQGLEHGLPRRGRSHISPAPVDDPVDADIHGDRRPTQADRQRQGGDLRSDPLNLSQRFQAVRRPSSPIPRSADARSRGCRCLRPLGDTRSRTASGRARPRRARGSALESGLFQQSQADPGGRLIPGPSRDQRTDQLLEGAQKSPGCAGRTSPPWGGRRRPVAAVGKPRRCRRAPRQTKRRSSRRVLFIDHGLHRDATADFCRLGREKTMAFWSPSSPRILR